MRNFMPLWQDCGVKIEIEMFFFLKVLLTLGKSVCKSRFQKHFIEYFFLIYPKNKTKMDGVCENESGWTSNIF